MILKDLSITNDKDNFYLFLKLESTSLVELTALAVEIEGGCENDGYGYAIPKPMAYTYNASTFSNNKEYEIYKGSAYCVKCKEPREFEGRIKTSDSGRRMAMGKCDECGTKLNRILGKAQ